MPSAEPSELLNTVNVLAARVNAVTVKELLPSSRMTSPPRSTALLLFVL
jgi:hypothetical protein